MRFFRPPLFLAFIVIRIIYIMSNSIMGGIWREVMSRLRIFGCGLDGHYHKRETHFRSSRLCGGWRHAGLCRCCQAGGQVRRKIYGIEPGNDGNCLILDIIEADDFGLGDFELVESREAGMLSQVAREAFGQAKRF